MAFLATYRSNKIINNSFWLLIDKFINLSAGFITTIILAREFGPSLFGEYSYLLTLI